MAEVKLKHVSKIFDGNVKAVDDICLEVQDKEFLILVGPSGCGKTTTLRMIAGLEEISEGELWIGDKLSNDVAAKDRDIAMVFQNYALYPHMTVYDNIAFGLKMRKVPKAEIKKRVMETAEILDLKPYLKRKPKALSGGQKQRVAMGRAIVRDPKVFLMDEPLSNLDAKLRGQMRVELSRLHRRLGATIVYVTHDQTEAMTLGQRIAVMNGGVIQQLDTPRNLYHYPANMFVAGFIGAPQINFIEAKCCEEAAGLTLQIDGESQLVGEGIASLLRDADYVGKNLVLGIRPEDISLRDPGEGCLQLGAKLRLDEMLGSESFLYLDSADREMVARIDGDPVYTVGEELKLHLPESKLHFFDAETQDAIRRSNAL